jgi:hypothetical protein
MALSGSPPLPEPSDLGRLLQDRLEKAHQPSPVLYPTTLDDLRIVADKLFAIAEACQTVTKRLTARADTYDAAAAFKQIERALDWAECMDALKRFMNSTN